jgi:hypothetical protein
LAPNATIEQTPSGQLLTAIRLLETEDLRRLGVAARQCAGDLYIDGHDQIANVFRLLHRLTTGDG